MNNYTAFVVGDLVAVEGSDDTGIVVEIGKHGQVHVFWNRSKKITRSGKVWAEIHMEVMSEGR